MSYINDTMSTVSPSDHGPNLAQVALYAAWRRQWHDEMTAKGLAILATSAEATSAEATSDEATSDTYRRNLREDLAEAFRADPVYCHLCAVPIASVASVWSPRGRTEWKSIASADSMSEVPMVHAHRPPASDWQ